MSKKPLIGINLDSEDTGSFSNYPYYALRKGYFHAVAACGGIPVGIPHEPELIEDYLNLVDGLLLSGGDFDINPTHYGENVAHESVKLNESRADFDIALITKALERDMPILAVCAGQQFLGALTGSQLYQDLSVDPPHALNHHQPDLRHEGVHGVEIEKASKLHNLMGVDTIRVNTSHRQALKTVGDGVLACGKADDGIIEAIELPDKKFVIGVQWHPEYFLENANPNRRLFEGLIHACQN